MTFLQRDIHLRVFVISPDIEPGAIDLNAKFTSIKQEPAGLGFSNIKERLSTGQEDIPVIDIIIGRIGDLGLRVQPNTGAVRKFDLGFLPRHRPDRYHLRGIQLFRPVHLDKSERKHGNQRDSGCDTCHTPEYAGSASVTA